MKVNSYGTEAKNGRVSTRKNLFLLLMVLPGAIWFVLFKYLPMIGSVIAFKDFKIDRRGFVFSLINSEWVGFENFKYLFASSDAFIIMRNTIGYNGLFIILQVVIPVAFAIGLNEIRSKRFSKIYQTGMIFPYFLSWVVASYFLFSFLSVDKGIMNNMLGFLGKDTVSWYSEPEYWPLILTIMALWKSVGYYTVFYLAAICGIDSTYYESAMIDGAKKIQQIRYITIPLLSPTIVILTLLAIGKIFYADFGLFYQIPRESGVLFPVTNVIDTFVYRGLMKMGDIGMTSAAGLYQSVLGFTLIMVSNLIVRRFDKDQALF
ncbi:carbohydrate ABC transporter membrane protein 1 (CUT1 family) [Anaerobacterium chartisolvens]|uniref:Carbohydrate ABC transporter membrane protein 1 (CUT1 family) n=1 Tax=Anaerobacterium chartisolvens TaxID=1297424 RepID=A0A369B8I6_9FIRM|nr:ABC transporter permease subunit [Anaerobacterium chartisolvens]RCX17842.1 carbohydrate ABC transporter membrane protein 1 (CUT1 family) [Anaerobacterium chartisolvens]